VGGEKDIAVNVRVIAATNKNLREEIEKKNFREDLYHRLSVILIHVPPLSERKDDLPLLASHFMADVCSNQGRALPELKPGAMEDPKNVRWTGNVRELRNVIERLAILCDDTVDAEDVKRFAQSLNS